MNSLLRRIIRGKSIALLIPGRGNSSEYLDQIWTPRNTAEYSRFVKLKQTMGNRLYYISIVWMYLTVARALSGIYHTNRVYSFAFKSILCDIRSTQNAHLPLSTTSHYYTTPWSVDSQKITFWHKNYESLTDITIKKFSQNDEKRSHWIPGNRRPPFSHIFLTAHSCGEWLSSKHCNVGCGWVGWLRLCNLAQLFNIIASVLSRDIQWKMAHVCFEIKTLMDSLPKVHILLIREPYHNEI